MAAYDLAPVSFDGVSLEAAPFDFVVFSPQNGPMQADANDPVEAAIVGVGSRHVRSQPRGANWELFAFLVATNESDRNAMLQVFSRERGLVYLVAADGDGVAWRVQCSVVGVNRLHANQYIIQLRVPDTRWETDALNTTTDNNNAGDSFALAGVSNVGDRRARPTIVIDADSAKTAAIANDFGYMERGFFVNRAPFALNDYPIELTFRNGVENPYNFIQTARSTTITNQINNGAGITATATSIDIDGAVGGGLPAGPAFAVIAAGGGTEEQIYYLTKTASLISGITRGIGGTAGSVHADNTVIRKSEVLLDFSDLRVYVDGQEVERWTGGTQASGQTRIWINASAPKRTVLTLKGALTATVPASAGEVQFNEDIAQIPEAGMFVINREMFSYTGRDIARRVVTGIERAVWWTAAAIHADAAKCYFNPRLFVTCFGRYGLGPAPDPIERRPAIQLVASRNTVFRWGDEADDASTIFYDPAKPNRPAQWRPGFEVPAADLNAAELPRLDTSTTKAAWKDSLPAPGKLQCGRLSVFLPTGTKVAATGVELDYQPRLWARMRLLGRDINGFETELLDQYDFAEVAVVGQDGNPTGILHELTLNAVRAATTGVLGSGGGMGGFTTDLALNGAHILQKIVLDNPVLLDAILLPLRKAGAGDNFTFTVILRDASGATPELGFNLWQAQDWSGNASTVNFTSAGLTLSNAWYRFTNPYGAMQIPAGTYWLGVTFSRTSGSLIWVRPGPSLTRNDRAYDAVAALYGAPNSFLLTHAHGGPVQADAAQLNAGVEASFDKVAITLNDAAADPYYPLVDRAGGTESLYHCIGVLSNSENSLTIAVDLFMELGKQLTIDCEKHTAYYVDGEWTLRCPGAITPSDASEWFALEPGVNDVTWTEQGMINTDMSMTFRSRRA